MRTITCPPGTEGPVVCADVPPPQAANTPTRRVSNMVLTSRFTRSSPFQTRGMLPLVVRTDVSALPVCSSPGKRVIGGEKTAKGVPKHLVSRVPIYLPLPFSHSPYRDHSKSSVTCQIKRTIILLLQPLSNTYIYPSLSIRGFFIQRDRWI